MKSLSKAEGVLSHASELINGPRQQSYGHPSENFSRLAERVKQHVGVDVEPWRVALLLAELKMARLANGYHADSVVDAVAYLALAGELHDDA